MFLTLEEFIKKKKCDGTCGEAKLIDVKKNFITRVLYSGSYLFYVTKFKKYKCFSVKNSRH